MTRQSNILCCKKPEETNGSQLRLDQLAKAIAHPIRLQILQLLKKKKACICGEIVDELPVAQATVSQHLKVLRDSGLIYGEIEGPGICYCINEQVLSYFKKMTQSL